VTGKKPVCANPGERVVYHFESSLDSVPLAPVIGANVDTEFKYLSGRIVGAQTAAAHVFAR